MGHICLSPGHVCGSYLYRFTGSRDRTSVSLLQIRNQDDERNLYSEGLVTNEIYILPYHYGRKVPITLLRYSVTNIS